MCGSLHFEHTLQANATANIIHKPTKIVQAVTVNQQQVQQQIAQIKAERRAQHNAEINHQKHLKYLAIQAEHKREQEQKLLKQLQLKQKKIEQQQKQAITKATNAVLRIKKQQQQMQQHLTELQKQRQQLENKLKTKTTGMQAQTRMETEKQLQQLINAERQQITATQAKQVEKEIERYKALIVNVIEQNWIIPSEIDKKLSAQLLIKLAPGGTVLEVKILQTSGNMVLDRSAVTAVWKASPLPVPKNGKMFQQMRELHLTVRPEGFLT